MCLRFLLLLLCVAVLPARAQVLSLSLERIEHPQFSARDLSLTVRGDGARADLSIGHLSAAGREFSSVKFECPRASLKAGVVDCPAGRLQAAGAAALPLSFRLDLSAGRFDLVLKPAPSEQWQVSAGWRGEQALALTLQHARLERLAGWLPMLKGWNVKGEASGSLRAGRGKAGDSLSGRLDVAGLSFGDASGNHAGERIAARLEVDATGGGDAWSWRLLAKWKEGEGYAAPVYLAKGGLALTAAGSLAGTLVKVEHAELALAEVGALAGSGDYDWKARRLSRLSLTGQGLELGKAGELLVAPFLEQAGLPKFRLAGRLDVAADWSGDAFSRLEIGIKDGGVEAPDGRLAFSAIDVNLPWRADGATQGSVSVKAGRVGKLPLGAFQVPLAMNGWSVQVPKVQIPVLDGAVILEKLRAVRKEGEWQAEVGASVLPLSMETLTRTLGLPAMSGTLSANIPRMSLEKGKLALDGTLVIQVFDGYLAVNGLSLDNAFGRAPALRAENVDIRHIDLSQFTHTFSFGDITGFMDGDIDGLELVDWQPQRFNGRLQSSPGDYRKRISQRAVENISSLGGAGASAAIERSFLSIFKTFGYDRIGLACRLENGICRMSGVADAPQGYVIVKGGGVPAINVIGYNRTVDWEELIARLKRVMENNAKPVIQ